MRIVHTLPAPVDEENARAPDELRNLANEGLGRRLAANKFGYAAGNPAAAKAQLDWELARITFSGRASQFLLLRDIIMRAGQLGIPVSPGYGRLGNSVLAFALGLCEPDPYAYGLVIERSSHIFHGAFGINVSADRCHELIRHVKDNSGADGGCRTVELVELPALDLMQGVADRVGLAGGADLWGKLPPDDAKTYELLGGAETEGVYQLESEPARRCLRGWNPQAFNDLLVLTTLNRYWTEELIPEVIARARGAGSGACADPIMKSVTAESFGFLIWQEQVVRALTELAGFDGDKGDRVWRVLCGKRPGEIKEARDLFVSGCMQLKGAPEHRAQSVWDELEKYSVYAVSKAHAVAHALLTYRMAYLKAHWPCEFEKAVRGLRKGGPQ